MATGSREEDHIQRKQREKAHAEAPKRPPARASRTARDLFIASAALDLQSRGKTEIDEPRQSDVSGKVVVITGASMGIGEAIARLFAENGARVVLLSRDAGRAEAARARIGRPKTRWRSPAMFATGKRSTACQASHCIISSESISGSTTPGHGIMDSVGSVDMAPAENIRHQFSAPSTACRQRSSDEAAGTRKRLSICRALPVTFRFRFTPFTAPPNLP